MNKYIKIFLIVVICLLLFACQSITAGQTFSSVKKFFSPTVATDSVTVINTNSSSQASPEKNISEENPAGIIVIPKVLTLTDSLYLLIDSHAVMIDSLMVLIDSLYTENERLNNSVEEASSRAMVNLDFVIPSEIEFGGQIFDLNNERIYEKFKKIYERELRLAHRYIPRSGKYFAYFDSVFSSYGIPLDVKYLAIAESNLSNIAASGVGAVGMWQFMPKTGKYYGLKINSYIDERQNHRLATDAAARYLINSYKYLGKRGGEDWLLSFCAYNAGEGSIARVMREQGGKKFFDLILRVDETNTYVWRAVAIKMIFENEAQIFGKKFEREVPIDSLTRIASIQLKGHHRIDDWAQAQGTVLSKVWELNPWIKIYKQRRKKYSAINNVVLPPGKYDILLPVKSVKNDVWVAKSEKKFMSKNSGFYKYHIVRRGDNLYDIARKYKTSVSKIKALNSMRGNTIRPGQKIRLQGSTGSKNYATSGKGTYRVKSGDTVGGIAGAYGISIKKLKSLNNLSSNMIHPGQVLVTRKNKPSSAITPVWDGQSHAVKSGDTLGKIARQYKVKIRSLKKLNKLDSNMINIGQKLKIPAQSTLYTVRDGDSLDRIARRHGISVNSLRTMNNLKGSIIKPGQKLKVSM